jgi:D-beta-D-heptose 7-phosphate kinase / D-beta-D-heptose 1-phosphate adenosyltransferase
MFQSFKRAVETVESGFGGVRTLVLGDLMLDRYLWGEVERISPEAPVPIVRVQHLTECAGGAANVAMNLRRLGCNVSVAGVVGTDVYRDALLSVLGAAGIGTDSVIAASGRQTTAKTRIIGAHQQMLRLDHEDRNAIASADINDILQSVNLELEKGVSAIVLSDYGKGVLTPLVCQDVIRTARTRGIPILVDPKGTDYRKYAGANGLSPNRNELARATGADAEDLQAVLDLGIELIATLGLDFIALTLSERGIALIQPDTISKFPALAREVFDVSGAGDTVIATLAASMAAGLPLHDAMQLANLAAGIVIGKLGTVPVTREELVAALAVEQAQDYNKICSGQELLNRIAQWRIAGERIVFTNGCFDILHVGHVSLLQKARTEGDRLVVGLNTDRSISSLKGPSRPITGQRERARVLAALGAVDAVVLFDDNTPLQLINTIRPDVLVKGADYSEEQVVGAAEVRSWGGRVALVPLVESFSTTAVLKRITARELSQ